ncbi:MAG: DUF2062 domain-containing protein, partial [Desulfosarcinaceae bacterium]
MDDKPNLEKPTIGDRLKRAFHRFLKMRGEPREIAFGMAVGVMVGMSPFMGFHTLIAVFFAAVFKWNKLAAALGVQITNVFTAPLIYPVVYMVGHAILGISALPNPEAYLSMEAVVELIQRSPLILADLTVGGIVLGIPLSIITYWITLKTVENYRKKIKPKLT